MAELRDRPGQKGVCHASRQVDSDADAPSDDADAPQDNICQPCGLHRQAQAFYVAQEQVANRARNNLLDYFDGQSLRMRQLQLRGIATSPANVLSPDCLPQELRQHLPTQADGERPLVLNAEVAAFLGECAHFCPFGWCGLGSPTNGLCIHHGDCRLRVAQGVQRESMLNLATVTYRKTKGVCNVVAEDAFKALVLDSIGERCECVNAVRFVPSTKEGEGHVLFLVLPLDNAGKPPCMQAFDKSKQCGALLSSRTGKGGKVTSDHVMHYRRLELDGLLKLYAAAETARHALAQAPTLSSGWRSLLQAMPKKFVLEVDDDGRVVGPTPFTGEPKNNASDLFSPKSSFMKLVHALELIAAANGKVLEINVLHPVNSAVKRTSKGNKKPGVDLDKMAKVLSNARVTTSQPCAT